jgi:hypothetical protein
MSFQRTKQVSKELKLVLTGKDNVCKASSDSKACQKIIMVKEKSQQQKSGRLHLDISSARSNEYKIKGQTNKPC